jgi:hypothetical protein
MGRDSAGGLDLRGRTFSQGAEGAPGPSHLGTGDNGAPPGGRVAHPAGCPVQAQLGRELDDPASLTHHPACHAVGLDLRGRTFSQGSEGCPRSLAFADRGWRITPAVQQSCQPHSDRTRRFKANCTCRRSSSLHPESVHEQTTQLSGFAHAKRPRHTRSPGELPVPRTRRNFRCATG